MGLKDLQSNYHTGILKSLHGIWPEKQKFYAWASNLSPYLLLACLGGDLKCGPLFGTWYTIGINGFQGYERTFQSCPGSALSCPGSALNFHPKPNIPDWGPILPLMV